MAEPERLLDLQKSAIGRLRAAGVDGADVDAAILLAEVLQCDRAALLRRSRDVIAAPEVERYRRLLAAREAGRPVSRILGRREFWSLSFEVCDDVLDPRSDSETLIEAVLRRRDRGEDLRILDLGTGSGCLLLALLSEYPAAHGLGVDLSRAALAAASRNAERFGLAARARFGVADWGDGIAERFDIVIANPPYIAGAEISALAREVRLHDPLLALDGGEDGLAAFRKLVPALPDLLRTGGLAVLECGIGQASRVSSLLNSAGFARVEIAKDLAGIERCLTANLSNRKLSQHYGEKCVGILPTSR